VTALRLRLRRLRAWPRRSFVPIPCAYLALAIVLGLLTPTIDKAIGGRSGAVVGLASARDVLTSMATGMIAFTGLVVTAVLLVVQFAAGQYSPRLVLWFGRDRVAKHAVGSFLAAPLFALVALRQIERERILYNPDVTVVIALVLLLGAAVLFLVLLQHVLDDLRPRSLYEGVARSGIRAARKLYPPLGDEHRPQPDGWRSAEPRELLHQHGTGVVAELESDVLVALAGDAGVTLELVPGIGEFIWRGQPLVRIHGEGSVDERLVRASVRIRDERTIEDDPAFAVRMIVDTAIRALSPAINDPTTAVHGIDALEVLIGELAARELEASQVTDEHGAVRLVRRGQNWPDMLALAFDEIRFYGASSLQVCRRLRAALERLEQTTPAVRHAALAEQLEWLDQSLARAFPPGSAELETAWGADRTGIGLTVAA
jgi:uncharacterized membrane protein